METNLGMDNIEEMPAEGIPASIPEAIKIVGQQRKRWYWMIKDISHRLGINRLTEEDLVVNIGCGGGLDSLPINSALSGQPFGMIGKIKLVGIDLDQKALQMAVKDNRGEVERYIHGDARNLGRLLEGQKPIVAIARQPNIVGKETEWKEIFQETYRTLKDGGTLIVTSMQGYERRRVKRALQDAGFQLVIDEENAFAGKTTFGDLSIQYDKYIAVGIKRENVQSASDESQRQSSFQERQAQQQTDKTKIGSLRQKLVNMVGIGRKKS